MRRLIFIDDDKAELVAFQKIVSRHYDYTAVSLAEQRYAGEIVNKFDIVVPVPPEVRVGR